MLLTLNYDWTGYRLLDSGNPFATLMSSLLSGASQLIAHPLEYGSMFQDRAGTTPVTAPGQLVGRVLDAGPGGYHATALSDAARGVFREVDGRRYIEYNGINTTYATPALPAPLVDKAQVFAGVRKLSDAAIGVPVELGPNASLNAGSFVFAAPATASAANYFWGARGSASLAGTTSPVNYAAPITNIIAGIGDITGDRSTLRIDGTQVAQSTADQGTGNYNPSGTYPLYYGARAGTSLFFNGSHYATLGPITRFGNNATADQIAAAEAYYTAEIAV